MFPHGKKVQQGISSALRIRSMMSLAAGLHVFGYQGEVITDQPTHEFTRPSILG
jgi:hypothetical protein